LSGRLWPLGALFGAATLALSGRGSAADANAGSVGNPAAVQELPQVNCDRQCAATGVRPAAEPIPSNVQTPTAPTSSARTHRRGRLLTITSVGQRQRERGEPVSDRYLLPRFTASPLLGTPEGLSVYVDGVRVMNSFAIPSLGPHSRLRDQHRVSDSGSNPVFGLNTLGGALSIQTRGTNPVPNLSLWRLVGRRSSRARPAANAARSIISLPRLLR